MLKIKYYNDPGHGWLAVKRKLLKELGISDKISSYSYQRGNTVYLEEDCDASVFMKAFKEKYGEFSYEISSKYVDKRHPIRYYSSYHNI